MHPLQTILMNRKESNVHGIVSICTANPYVLKACFRYFKHKKSPLLIEATANQVNQYGGYTGMLPNDFINFVYDLAKEENFPLDKLFLGGDHLGPLTWSKDDEKTAMEKAKILVWDFVLAGFTKIHLDTSMKLADDDKDMKLSTEIIASRGIELMKECELAYVERLKKYPDSIPPIYILGSEVPIPGGAQEDEGIQVTSIKDFEETVSIYHKLMEENNLINEWDRVVAFVVQPGVEFGDDSIHHYERLAAKKLIQCKSNYPTIVFEGHSTDYQTPSHLKEMVADDITILKVGPALTFALREALFALSNIEDEILKNSERSNFKDTLEKAMVENPKNWANHYHGSESQLAYKRKYSFSDRARYYMPKNEVDISIMKLLENTNELPLTILSQFMPYQYRKVKEGTLENSSISLIDDYISMTLDDYLFALED